MLPFSPPAGEGPLGLRREGCGRDAPGTRAAHDFTKEEKYGEIMKFHGFSLFFVVEVCLMMCTHIRSVFNDVHSYNGAPFNGAPFDGAPFHGAS